MFNFEEIKLQNMQDAFSAMYAQLAKSAVEAFGELEGGSLIREGVRRAGRASGSAMLRRHREAGVRPDLQRLYGKGCGRNVIPDPRFRGKLVAEEAERRIWEVYSCPLAHFWNVRGLGRLGGFFCEEFEYARILAYTEGCGQLNLSNRLTCERDDFCLFAAFFREANRTGIAGRAVGASSGAADVESSAERCEAGLADLSFEESIRELTASVYYYILETAVERFGEDGRRAVRAGLAAWGGEAAAALRDQAERTQKAVDAAFIKKNFPLEADSKNDAVWETLAACGARELMQELVLDRIRESGAEE